MIEKKISFITKMMKLTVLVALVTACSTGVDEAASLSKAREYYQNRDLMAASIELKNVLQANPRNAEARFLLGSINLKIGDATSAEKDLRRALENGWDEATTQLLLAEVLFRKKEYQAILETISIKDSYPDNLRAEFLGLQASAEQALGKWGDSEGSIITAETIYKNALWVMKSRAMLQLFNGDTASANDIIERAIELYPLNHDLWLFKASLAREKGDLAAIDENMQKVVDLEPLKIVTVWGRKARKEQCRVRLLQDQVETALETLEPALGRFPGDPEMNYYRSVIAFRQGEDDVANDYLLKVFKVDPNHYASLSLSGNLNYKNEDYSQAAYYLEKATRVRPNKLGNQMMLGKTYMKLGLYKKADQRLKFVASRTGENAGLLTLMGISAISGGDSQAGLRKLERAAASAPDNTGIRNELAKAYMTTGEVQQAIDLLESAHGKSDDAQQDVKTRLILAQAYLQSGEFNKAIKLANDLAKLLPDSPLPYHLEGVAYEGKGDYAAARNSYRKALSIKSDFILSMLGQAGLDVIAGDVEQARKRYEAILKLQPENSAAMTSLASIMAREGKKQETIDLLEKVKKADSKAMDPRIILSLYKLQEGKAVEALVLAEEARLAAPDDPRVLLALGEVQLANGVADAEKTLLRFTEKLPLLPEGHLLLARARAASGNLAGARASLDKVLELAPDHVQARLVLGNLELRTGNARAAMQIAKNLKSSDEGKADGYLLEGDVFMQSKQSRPALKAYQAASDLIPWSSDPVVRINNAYRSAGNNKAGIKVLLQWLNNKPDDLGIRFVLAVSYLADGKFDAARAEYKKILDKQPENADVMNELAWLNHQQGKPGALEMARKASKLAPDNPVIQDTYGWILVQSGGTRSGLDSLKYAASKLPDNREIQYHLAFTLAETGQTDKAKQILSTILQDAKPFSDRDKAKVLFDKIK